MSVRSLLCVLLSRQDSPQKNLKWQFLKLRNLHCCNWDPACIQCGTYQHGGRRCSVPPWVCRSCCVQQQLYISWWGGLGSRGPWRVKMNLHGVAWRASVPVLSLLPCHSRTCGGKLRGAAQLFPRSACAAVPFLQTHVDNPALARQCLPVSCCRWMIAWPAELPWACCTSMYSTDWLGCR